jgi:hypothetical protein
MQASTSTAVRGRPASGPCIAFGNDVNTDVLERCAVVIVHPNTFRPRAGCHVLGDPVVATDNGWEPLLHKPRVLFELDV